MTVANVLMLLISTLKGKVIVGTDATDPRCESLDSEETAEQLFIKTVRFLLEFNDKPNSKGSVIAFVTAIYYVTTTADTIICNILFVMYSIQNWEKNHKLD